MAVALMPGFMQGQADNLPKVDSMAVFSFLGSNPDFMGAEIRGFKAQRSGRENYGDNAIGYVQVKRDGPICMVNARVTPEHSVKKKAYNVEFQCNESVGGNIISVQCKDCAASSGGCKHAIALLMWLHRRSEEPSVTSTESYWKKSNLSCVGSSIKFIQGKQLVENDLPALTPPDRVFLRKTAQIFKEAEKEDTVVTKYYTSNRKFWNLSMHHLALMFFDQASANQTAEAFIQFCSSKITESLCSQAIDESAEQSESSLWHQMRYGRITASRAHEASRCKTMDGSLVETIVGATTLKDTVAMERGRRLEKVVRKVVEREKNLKIKLSGFATSPELPIMGATPDGITENYVIEIKCPSSEKAIQRYVKNNSPTEKCNAQIQMQMHFFKKKWGLFCVAAPDFETSKQVNIVEVQYDEKKCRSIIEHATTFWKAAVFPFLKNLN